MLAQSVSFRNELRPKRKIAVSIQQSVGGEAEAIPTLHDFFHSIAVQRVQSPQITDRRRRVHHHCEEPNKIVDKLGKHKSNYHKP